MTSIDIGERFYPIQNGRQLQEGPENQDESGAPDWLRVIGMLVLFVVFLVLLRFILNCIIDVFVLRDFRQISQFRRKICPWWHPQTRPQPESQQNEINSHSQLQLITMERLLAGMSFHEKHELLTGMLQSEIATPQDLERWKLAKEQTKMHTSNSSNCSSKSLSLREEESCCCSPNRLEPEMDCEAPHDGSKTDFQDDSDRDLICPICIHAIEVEQPIISLPCLHRFHSACLIQWLSTHTRDCPYCRTEILTQGMLDQAYRQRHAGHSVENR